MIDVPNLVNIGDVITTSYESGPYFVRRLERHANGWSLVLSYMDGEHMEGDERFPRINQLRVEDGRIRNQHDDEIYVHDRPACAPAMQVDLF